MTHDDFMRMALEEAKKGIGKVEPNPYVGAALVKNGKVLSLGYHRYFGGPHAEVDALSQISLTGGSTMYVNLEPCCHTGKTPPCTDAILRSGIKEVYIATKDTNKLINGNGIKVLKKAGLKVNLGILEKESAELNRHFFYFHRTGLPYVICKWAMTLDGKIASKTGDSKWISSEPSRALVKKLRKECQAVLVGVGTVIRDDPALAGVTRIILDSRGRTPLKGKIAKSARENRTIIVTTEKAKGLEKAGCEIIRFSKMDITSILKRFAEMGIIKIFAEGGSEINGSLFDQDLVCEVYAYISPKLVGGSEAKTPIGGRGLKIMGKAITLRDITVDQIDGDILVHGFLYP